MLLDKKNIHFIGIAGIGMSAIARVLLEMGYNVSGSDLEPNDLTGHIKEMGAHVFEGHAASNVSRDVDLIVYSSSISKNNPELLEAHRRKIPVAHRAEVLGELLNRKKGIAVTGTHGKTTTTSLISIMLENSNLDPTVMIGGEVGQFKGNAKFGKGAHLVAEADESDSSFLHFKPMYSVITNIEMEHLDHFKTLGDVRRAYRAFANNLKKGGILFYNREDPNIKEALKNFKGRTRSFGVSRGADIYPVDIKMNEFKTSFTCVYKNKKMGTASLGIPGMHNVLNSLAAILVGLNLGLGFEDIVNSIKSFKGVRRRFHLRADSGGVMLIDDYAHHPTEIRAVLDACRNWKGKRLIAIFQPHRYTRTKHLAGDFGKCFRGVDMLILTDIYAASEEPIKGVSVKNIYDRAIRSGLDDVKMLKKEDIAGHVMKLKKPGDMILVMGAGDIKNVADKISERLKGEGGFRKNHIAELRKLVKGRVVFKEKMSPHTSFRIGGPADIWAEPRDIKDLRRILIFAGTKRIPLFVIGSGTNLLVNDRGFKGMVIRLGAEFFNNIEIKGNCVKAGAGFNVSRLVRICCDRSLGGIESLVGIPGTVGGAVYMNAGGSANPIYRNIGEFVTSLEVIDYKGRIKRLRKGQLEFGYRRSNLDPYIILEACLTLEKGDAAELRSRASRFLKMKRDKQALDMPSAGCVFKNPENSQFTCGQMIDMLGLKGARMGGAEISKKHANFIVNRNGATFRDVSGLIDLIRKKVDENFKIPLELEIKII